MGGLSLSLNDLGLHVVQFGLDIYPQVEIPNERTRLNIFYEEVRNRWPDLSEILVASDTEFRISKTFQKGGKATRGTGAGIPTETFVLSSRGPVFISPILLPAPVGATGIKESECVETFQEMRGMFLRALPNRTILRVGVVREVIFETGQIECHTFLTSENNWCGARLAGGILSLRFLDARCNLNVRLEPITKLSGAQLPVGTTVTEKQGYGLGVRLDVNNLDIRPLGETDIQEVLDRAAGLWPNSLLEYVQLLAG